jgi:hypothetical protein
MSMPPLIPTQDEFLAAPVEVVAAVVPRSMVYAPGGTRRSAMFAGVEPWSTEYVHLGHEGITKCIDLVFRHGVEHVFTPAIMAGHAREVGAIEQTLFKTMSSFLADPHLLALVREYGWRMRIAPSAYADVLRPLSESIERDTASDGTRTWWLTVTPSIESWWSTFINLAKSEQVYSRADAILALYGEAVPPIRMCLAFGKPMVAPDLFPPLLMDDVQCYWSQQAGYSLTEQQFRRIVYDYAYLRQTWQEDKTERAKAAMAHQEIWERETIVGLGKRLGPFWYPDLS